LREEEREKKKEWGRVIDYIVPRSRLAPHILRLTLWSIAILLFVLVLRTASLADTWAVLRQLHWWQLLLLIIANGLVILLMNGRWWLILRRQGHPIPYLTLTGYRLAGAGLSYFTPGPQFGGEPLQVLLIERNYQVPRATAVAAIALDKTLELIVNFSFLTAGIVLLWQIRLMGDLGGWQTAVIPLLLLSLPLTFLLSIWFGQQPLTYLVQRVMRLLSWRKYSDRMNIIQRLQLGIQASEQQLALFCRNNPRTLSHAFLISLLGWAALIAEFWLMLSLFGIQLTFVKMLVALTAARIAILLPLPGGLGTLEASQILVLTAFGFSPATALGFSLLIRARDILLACLGLGWAKVALSTLVPS
jgi:uncharacterized protein (TIRG00374 family)